MLLWCHPIPTRSLDCAIPRATLALASCLWKDRAAGCLLGNGPENPIRGLPRELHEGPPSRPGEVQWQAQWPGRRAELKSPLFKPPERAQPPAPVSMGTRGCLSGDRAEQNPVGLRIRPGCVPYSFFLF